MNIRTIAARALAAAAALAILSGCSNGVQDAVVVAPTPAAAESAVEGAVPAEAQPVGGQPEGAQPAEAQPATLARTVDRLSIFTGTPSADVQGAVVLKATEKEGFGTYLADQNGMTLYRFDKDTTNPAASNCNGECASTWPPLIVTWPASVYLDGVDPNAIGYIERADGTCQLTVNNWPVYYFASDRQAGDINGEGIGGSWFAIAPDGKKAAQ